MKHSAGGLVALLSLIALASAQTVSGSTPANTRFVCDTGYSLQQCHQQVAVLRSVLARYLDRQPQQWTWVLVRSANWKPILTSRGLDPTSPAFSFLTKQETFVEEALLAQVAERRVELLKKWQMPLDQLLELAVTHELGHALCNEQDEAKADRIGQMLREGKPVRCRSMPGTNR